MSIKDITVPTPADTSFEDVVKALRYDPVNFVTNLAHSYGDIVRLPFGSRALYLLNHPDYIQDVFVGKAQSFAKRKDTQAEKTYLSQIAPMFPIFQQELIATYAPAMVEAAANTHVRWQSMYQQHDLLTVDMYKEIMRITVPIVCKTLFQVDTEADSAAVVDALLRMDVGYGFDTIATTLGPVMPPVDVSTTPEMEAARSDLIRFMQRLIDAYRTVPHDSVSLFSELFKPQVKGQPLSDEQVAGIALTVFCAMHEVTATTLPWTWYLLSQHPEVEAQLHAELMKVLAGRLPTVEDLPNLPYTYMVLKEGRRLYPSVWLAGRFVRDDVSFAAHVVPADSVVLMSQKVMHRDSRYFPNPNQFDPLRWTPEAVAQRPEFSYFPFSAGPRQCLGRDFAQTTDALILATLAQYWQARLVPGQRLEPHPQKSFAPRYGIQMTLHPR